MERFRFFETYDVILYSGFNIVYSQVIQRYDPMLLLSGPGFDFH